MKAVDMRTACVFATVFALMLLTVNIVYVTGYTAPMIELSRNFCRGVMYLERVEWFYTDVIKVGNRYAFAGPIGIPLFLSPIACLLDSTRAMLLAGGALMSFSVLMSMVFSYLVLKELFPSQYAYRATSIVTTVLCSLPWIYSSHLFPQAVLTMCYSALLYLSAKLVLSEDVSLNTVMLHAVISSIAFLADPSSVALVVTVATIVLIDKRSLLKRRKGMLAISVASWMSIFILVSLPQFYYNYATTGDPLLFPELIYSQLRGLGTGFDVLRIPVGMVIQLLDLRKSLLSLYPLSFISLLYTPYALRYIKKRSLAVLYVSMIFVPIAVYSSWHDFHGGLSFGPRFLTPVAQLLSLSLFLLLNLRGRVSRIVLPIGMYSAFVNSIVLISTPYPCAIQHLDALENQFYECSLKSFLSGTRSALIAELISRVPSIEALASNIISAGLVFGIATSVILLSYIKKI
ncbi:MAG: hypothetical protein QXD14_04050 [Sulfolobales archaeon]